MNFRGLYLCGFLLISHMASVISAPIGRYRRSLKPCRLSRNLQRSNDQPSGVYNNIKHPNEQSPRAYENIQHSLEQSFGGNENIQSPNVQPPGVNDKKVRPNTQPLGLYQNLRRFDKQPSEWNWNLKHSNGQPSVVYQNIQYQNDQPSGVIHKKGRPNKNPSGVNDRQWRPNKQLSKGYKKMQYQNEQPSGVTRKNGHPNKLQSGVHQNIEETIPTPLTESRFDFLALTSTQAPIYRKASEEKHTVHNIHDMKHGASRQMKHPSRKHKRLTYNDRISPRPPKIKEWLLDYYDYVETIPYENWELTSTMAYFKDWYRWGRRPKYTANMAKYFMLAPIPYEWLGPDIQVARESEPDYEPTTPTSSKIPEFETKKAENFSKAPITSTRAPEDNSFMKFSELFQTHIYGTKNPDNFSKAQATSTNAPKFGHRLQTQIYGTKNPDNFSKAQATSTSAPKFGNLLQAFKKKWT